MTSPVVVSLFSGAGGLSLGLSMAGLKPTLAIDIHPQAVSTYRNNLSAAVVQADVAADGMALLASIGQRPFLIAGGPPCQGFSSAGQRIADDPRSGMLDAYLQMIASSMPDWLMFENVEGVLTTAGGEVLLRLLRGLATLGYSFRLDRVEMASWGLAQARKRVLVIGNRLGIPFPLPSPTHSWKSRRRGSPWGVPGPTATEVLAGLPAELAAWTSRVSYAHPAENPWDCALRGDMAEVTHHTALARSTPAMGLLEPGQSLGSLAPEMHPPSWQRRANRRVADGVQSGRRGGAPLGLRRLHPDHASPTITGAASRELVHPLYPRPLSLRECARLQGFPDSWQFSGNRAEVAQQIGNAFPPPIACLLAQAIQEAHGSGLGISTPMPPSLMETSLSAVSASPALRKFLCGLRSLLVSNR